MLYYSNFISFLICYFFGRKQAIAWALKKLYILQVWGSLAGHRLSTWPLLWESYEKAMRMLWESYEHAMIMLVIVIAIMLLSFFVIVIIIMLVIVIVGMGRSFPSEWRPLTTLCSAGVGTGPWGSPSLGHVRSGHVGRVQGGCLSPWTPPWGLSFHDGVMQWLRGWGGHPALTASAWREETPAAHGVGCWGPRAHPWRGWACRGQPFPRPFLGEEGLAIVVSTWHDRCKPWAS